MVFDKRWILSDPFAHWAFLKKGSNIIVSETLYIFWSLTDDKDTISTAEDIFLKEINAADGEFRGEDIDTTSTSFEGETSTFIGILSGMKPHSW